MELYMLICDTAIKLMGIVAATITINAAIKTFGNKKTIKGEE